MQEKVWFFSKGEQQEGPVLESELRRMLTRGELPTDALVWAEHMTDWQPAASINDLVVSRKAVPPPIPTELSDVPAREDLLTPHPWHRYFARVIDHAFAMVPATVMFMAVGMFLQYIVFNNNMTRDVRLPSFGFMFLCSTAVYMIIEPLILGITGTTLGKFIFNIKLRNTFTAQKIGFIQAAKRTFFVWLRGGQSIACIPVPILSTLGCMAMQIYQLNRLMKTGITSWDRDGNISYEHHPMGPGRWLAFGIAMFLAVLIIIGVLTGWVSLFHYLKDNAF